MTDRERAETGGPDPDAVRTEAERLVATGLAAVAMAADRVGAPTRERGGAAAASFDALGDMLFGPAGHRRHRIANGSPECCRCPVCRAIAAARNPSPDFAERLATGVGFMAEGAARVLRGVAGAAGTVRTAGAGSDAGRGPGPAPEPDPWAAATAEPDPWAAATAEPPVAPAPTGTKAVKKATAKKAVKKAVKKQAPAAKIAKKTATKKAAGDQDR
jgi:hypothetical protein